MHHFRTDNLIRRCRSITCNVNDTTRHIKQTFAFWEVSDFSSLSFSLCLFSYSIVHSAAHFPALFYSLSLHSIAHAYTLQQLYRLLSILKINLFMYTCEYFWLRLYDRIHTAAEWKGERGREEEREREQGAFRAFSYKEKESVSTVCESAEINPRS